MGVLWGLTLPRGRSPALPIGSCSLNLRCCLISSILSFSSLEYISMGTVLASTAADVSCCERGLTGLEPGRLAWMEVDSPDRPVNGRVFGAGAVPGRGGLTDEVAEMNSMSRGCSCITPADMGRMTLPLGMVVLTLLGCMLRRGLVFTGVGAHWVEKTSLLGMGGGLGGSLTFVDLMDFRSETSEIVPSSSMNTSRPSSSTGTLVRGSIRLGEEEGLTRSV